MVRDRQNQVGGPPPLDEGWWAAVMQDEMPESRDHVPRRDSARHAPTGNGRDGVDWDAARQLYETDEPVELEVIGHNRGGLIVGLHALRGFVPASHLMEFPTHAAEDERRAALAQRVGQRLHLKVIEYDPAKGRIVFSERAAQASPGSRRHVLESLKPGDVVEGLVTNVCDFGAFVDLGGLEGLIHVSEVSWNRVAHPRDLLNCNQRVTVAVVSVDRDQARIALSLKRLRPDPWHTVEQRYAVGQVVSGTVTNVVNFGAFVCLEDGVEGLIHVSELADGSFLHPRSVLHEGEQVWVRIMNIDGTARRLGLSLRRAPLIGGQAAEEAGPT